MVFLKAFFNFYQIEHEKLSLLSLKPSQISVWPQNLFQYAFDTKIKKIQVINMVSIKIPSYYSLKYLPFFSKHLINRKSTKPPNNLINL